MNLLPCPFCGSENVRMLPAFGKCYNCGALGPCDEALDAETVARLWNTRFPSSVPVQETAGGGPSLTAEISVEAGSFGFVSIERDLLFMVALDLHRLLDVRADDSTRRRLEAITNLLSFPSQPPTPSDGPSDAHQVAGFLSLVGVCRECSAPLFAGAVYEQCPQCKAAYPLHPVLPRTEDKEATPGGTEPARVQFKDQWGHTVSGFVNHLGVEEGYCAACDRMVRGKW